MEEGTIGRRYARALAETLEESNANASTMAKIESELTLLGSLMADKSGVLRQVMTDPSITVEQRLQVMKVVTDKNDFQAENKNFISLLVRQDRMRFISAIAAAFANEVDERTKRVRAVLTSAKELSASYQKEIIAALEKRMGKTVIAETVVDPSVISGVRAEIGGMVIDGTVRAQLDRLQGSLRG